MNRIALIVSVSLIAAGVGCKTSSPGMPVAPAVTSAQLDSIRAEYSARHPGTKIGVVSEVLAAEPFVAVGDIDVTGVKVGQAITFIDSNQEILTNGTVVNIALEHLYVKIDPPAAGKRGPVVGDLAVQVGGK